ncbi:hypothetical protein EHV15_26290 [Paenibacillus oralis]|uniref:Uncharacterized protein n=1 Tax=Paenibacillus oralis TaxID=2490856 RepID=A0A3P3UC50_9BACL|nr:hypothetical protein [Paenibacillus oralis]RRJ66033.1 hypothetical protein EHV15_26290 [Paenibacillus oralis]
MKSEYSKYFFLVRRVINELAPVGLVKNGTPEYVHDSLTGQVLLLMISSRMNEVEQLILNAYEWYGFGVAYIVEEYKENFYNKIEIIVRKLNDLYKEYKHEYLADS